MALKKCPSCKQSVSKKAVACPGCGHPFKKQRKGTSGLGCLFLILVGGALLYAMLNSGPTIDTNEVQPPSIALASIAGHYTNEAEASGFRITPAPSTGGAYGGWNGTMPEQWPGTYTR